MHIPITNEELVRWTKRNPLILTDEELDRLLSDLLLKNSTIEVLSTANRELTEANLTLLRTEKILKAVLRRGQRGT